MKKHKRYEEPLKRSELFDGAFLYNERTLINILEQMIVDYTKGRTAKKYSFKETNKGQTKKAMNSTEYIYTWERNFKEEKPCVDEKIKKKTHWKCVGKVGGEVYISIMMNHYHPQAVQSLYRAIALLEKREKSIRNRAIELGLREDMTSGEQYEIKRQAVHHLKNVSKRKNMFTAESIALKGVVLIYDDMIRRDTIDEAVVEYKPPQKRIRKKGA